MTNPEGQWAERNLRAAREYEQITDIPTDPPTETPQNPEEPILPEGKRQGLRIFSLPSKQRAPKDLSGIPLIEPRFPITLFPKAREGRIPLYTTKPGKQILIGTAKATGTLIEAGRGIKDRLLEAYFHTDLDPEITVVDTEDLTVTLHVPIVQIANPGTTKSRINRATKELLETGHFSVAPKLPPGKNTKDGSVIVPTPSPDHTSGVLNPIDVARRQTNRLLKINKDWPIGQVEFKATGMEQAWRMLQEKGLLSEANQAQAHLLHDLTITTTIQYLDKQGNKLLAENQFPLGQAALQFNPDGTLKTSAYEINGVYFHPALLSLQDFTNLMSAKILETSQGDATMYPRILKKAVMLAPSADEDTKEIIESYIGRMLAIGGVNTLINFYPGELSKGICRVINIVDRSGNPHPQADKISATILGTLLGFEDVPGTTIHDRPTTYISLISFMHQLFKQSGAYVEFAGNPKIISEAVEHARDFPEVLELVRKMGINNPKELQESARARKVMHVAEFFSFYLTPQIINASALSILALQDTNANLINAELEMEMHRLRIINAVVNESLRLDKDYWESLLKEFLDRVKTINAAAAGEKAAEDVVSVIQAKYEAAKQGVVDAAVNPKSLPTKLN